MKLRDIKLNYIISYYITATVTTYCFETCAEIDRNSLDSLNNMWLQLQWLQSAGPMNTKNLQTKIRWLKLSGKCPVGLEIPPLNIKTLLELNHRKSRIVVWRLAVPWRCCDCSYTCLKPYFAEPHSLEDPWNQFFLICQGFSRVIWRLRSID